MTEAHAPRTLQELMDGSDSFVDRLFANRKGSVVRDAVLRQPTEFVAPEFTNWRDEQRAWRETVALYDQSFHMTTTFVRGPDALAFVTSVGVNGFATFEPGKARHFVCCSPSGHVIGDGVLYFSHPEEIALVGRAAGHNWLQFQAETGAQEEFGMLFEKGSPLVPCVNQALQAIKDDGTLAAIEQEWPSDTVNVPVLQ